MKKLFLSAGVGLVTGIVTFFLSVAFLCVVLLVLRSVKHAMPDMTLAYKAAIPVAIFGAILGFMITLFRPKRPRPVQ